MFRSLSFSGHYWVGRTLVLWFDKDFDCIFTPSCLLVILTVLSPDTERKNHHSNCKIYDQMEFDWIWFLFGIHFVIISCNFFFWLLPPYFFFSKTLFFIFSYKKPNMIKFFCRVMTSNLNFAFLSTLSTL